MHMKMTGNSGASSATEVPSVTPTATWAPSPVPTATLTPTPESVPGTLYVPLALQHGCRPVEQHTDVVLAIDASSSMREMSAGVTKIDAARDAAQSFVDLLVLGADQAAIVAFNEQATLVAPLTGDRAALVQAIDGIATDVGTRIDRALAVSAGELTSIRARPGNNRVIVIMTDGHPSGGTEAEARAAAADARRRGVAIFAVGLGDDVDTALLSDIAPGPDAVLLAPAATELRAIYGAIAGRLPCPGGVIWHMQ